MNVLIISGGGFQGHTVLKELNAISGLEVHVADIYSENTTRYFTSHYSIFPHLSDPSFIDHLKKYILNHRIEVVFPATAYELKLLSELKEKASFRIAVSSKELISIFTDKNKTYQYIGKNKFEVLRVVQPENINASEFFPLIAKPASGFGGKEISVLKKHSDFLHWTSEHKNSTDFVLQEYIEDFTEYSADFAIDFAGEVSSVNLRSRLRQSGGFATVTSISFHQRILSAVESLAKIIAKDGGCGIFNVQVLEKENHFYFSDLNPRMGTSAIIGEQHGNNLCAFVMASLGVRHSYFIDERPKKAIRFLEEKFILHRETEIKAVIFDLDDTLLPHKKWIMGKLDLLHDQLDIDLPKTGFLAEALKQLENGHRADLIDRLAAVFHFPLSQKEDLIEAYRKLIPATPLYNDVLPTLKALKEKRMITGLLTDNPPASQRQKIEAFQLEKYFDQIIFTREEGGEKPYIGAFDQLLKKINIPLHEIVYVGDHLHKDILGAHLAGIKNIFWIQRKGGFFNFDEEEFRRINPSIDFSTIEDLYSLIGYIDGPDHSRKNKS